MFLVILGICRVLRIVLLLIGLDNLFEYSR